MLATKSLVSGVNHMLVIQLRSFKSRYGEDVLRVYLGFDKK